MTTIKTSAIGVELRRLAEEHGGELRPDVVVEAASAVDSPLHDWFEWDDSAAAQQWRLHQARMLIRAVVVYEPNLKGKLLPCRVFVSLTPDRVEGGAGYRLTTAVLSDAARRQQLLADALAEMKCFREKYRMLSELADVFVAMDRATDASSEAETPSAATA